MSDTTKDKSDAHSTHHGRRTTVRTNLGSAAARRIAASVLSNAEADTVTHRAVAERLACLKAILDVEVVATSEAAESGRRFAVGVAMAACVLVVAMIGVVVYSRSARRTTAEQHQEASNGTALPVGVSSRENADLPPSSRNRREGAHSEAVARGPAVIDTASGAALADVDAAVAAITQAGDLVMDPSYLLSALPRHIATKQSWATSGRKHVWWYCAYGDGIVLYNQFRSYRKLSDVVKYFTVDGDCDSFFYRCDDRRQYVTLTGSSSGVFAREHGGIIDIGVAESPDTIVAYERDVVDTEATVGEAEFTQGLPSDILTLGVDLSKPDGLGGIVAAKVHENPDVALGMINARVRWSNGGTLLQVTMGSSARCIVLCHADLASIESAESRLGRIESDSGWVNSHRTFVMVRTDRGSSTRANFSQVRVIDHGVRRKSSYAWSANSLLWSPSGHGCDWLFPVVGKRGQICSYLVYSEYRTSYGDPASDLSSSVRLWKQYAEEAAMVARVGPRTLETPRDGPR